jgi:Flp pilus assembly protein protease CpaA
MTTFLFIIIILYLFYDFRYRRIPNYYFFLFLSVGFLFGLIELIAYYEQFRVFVLNKIIFFVISLYIIFYLFQIKIFGGADCKFIILIFIFTPFFGLSYNFYLFFYFFFLSFYFGLLCISYLIKRAKKKHPSFEIYFETHDIHKVLKKHFFRIYFIFIDYVEIRSLNKDKYYIASYDLIFNYSSFTLQVLFQYRAPLVPLITLVYILCSLLFLN